MPRTHVIAIVLSLLAVAGGCAGHKLAASNAKIVELRRALYSYMMGPGHEPIDSPENSGRIFAMLKDIEPLDNPEKINVALDIFEYYDAMDNLASSYAREILVKYGRSTLPFVRDRMKSALNRRQISDLIAEIEGS